MRISDWSSDVCSSDLPVIIGFELRPVFACGEAFRRLSRTAGHGQSFALPVYTVTSAERPEIGRASCRERVCQYVYISVVAVSLKKNTYATHEARHSIYIVEC